MWTGAPCTAGNREVTCTALTTCSRFIGLMDTTIGPENIPADAVGMLVMNIGTVESCSMWRMGMSTLVSAFSNEKLHPSRNDTRSSRQNSDMSSTSAVISPYS